MSQSAEQMHAYYAARAGEYDSIYRKPERQTDLRAIEAWLPARFKGRRVLEVACGTGYWTQFIAPVASRLLGVDAAPETLEIASTRVQQENAEFEIGDAYALPRRPLGFDAAFAGFWFSHVPLNRQREFLAGLGQVLEPGATVVLLDNLYVEGNSTPLSERDAEGNTWQLRTLQDGSQHRVLKNYPTPQGMQQAIDGLGSQGRFMQWQYFWAFEYVVTAA